MKVIVVQIPEPQIRNCTKQKDLAAARRIARPAAKAANTRYEIISNTGRMVESMRLAGDGETWVGIQQSIVNPCNKSK